MTPHAEAVGDIIFKDSFERCENAGEVPVNAVLWDGGGDGASWNDAMNWSGDVIPSDGDFVSIRLEGEVTVVYDASLGTTSLSGLDSCESLHVTGGILEVNGPGRIGTDLLLSGGMLTASADFEIRGALQQTGGILGGPGVVSVSGLLSWSGGNQTGAGESIANGGANITGGNDKLLISRTLTLNDTSVWAGDVRLSQGATVNNNAATDIQSNHPLLHSGGDVPTFNNSGTLSKSAGDGTTKIEADFFNTGTVAVNNGTIRLGKAGTVGTSDGVFTVAATATLGLAGMHTMLAASSFSGAGGVTVSLTGSDVLIQGDYLVTGPLRVSAGLLTLDAGPVTLAAVNLTGGTLTSTANLEVTGTFNQTGGILTGTQTVTVAGLWSWSGGDQTGAGESIANGGVNITSGNDKLLTSRTLTLNDTSVWAGDVRLSQGATVNNNAATDIQSNDKLADNGGAESTFNNNLTLTKSAGDGNTEFEVEFINFGTLGLTNGSVSFDRTFVQNPTGSLEVRIGSLAFDNYTTSQAATLDGTLDIILLNSFEPDIGQMFVIMNFDSRAGTTFATVNGLTIGNGKKFEVLYGLQTVTLSVVTDP